jgi:hypothetical protein
VAKRDRGANFQQYGPAPSGGGVSITTGGGNATLSAVQIFSNTATALGGGVGMDGSGVLTITDNSLIAYNRATASSFLYGGGGLALDHEDAVLRMIGGQIFSNTTLSGGGGFFIGEDGGSASLERVAIINNSAVDGGGINNFGVEHGSSSMLTIINSTISHNRAIDGGEGGGIYTGDNATTVLTFTTITSNTATSGGRGLHQALGGGVTVLVQNSLVVYNGLMNCSPGVTSNGYNLDSANTCGFTVTGDITNTNPLLGPLTESNGTRVHPLLAGSPAIDKGNCVTGITTDQRGFSRPLNGGCDIGAVEWTSLALSIADTSLAEGDSGISTLVFTLTLTEASSLPVTVTVATADGVAQAGSDYVGIIGGLVTIPAGQITGVISVTLNGDTEVEAEETFTVTLSSPVNATLADGSAVGAILNDDQEDFTNFLPLVVKNGS